jgi:hypothetical protein
LVVSLRADTAKVVSRQCFNQSATVWVASRGGAPTSSRARTSRILALQAAAVGDIWLLRLRALLARAHGDATAYADFRDRYRDMAKTLGFEGHIDWAEAMP